MLYDPKWDNPSIRVLNLAQGLIRAGWIQHQFKNEFGVCAQQAIIDAARRLEQLDGPVNAAMERVIRDKIVPWNDRAGRTREQVLDAMEQAKGILVGGLVAA